MVTFNLYKKAESVAKEAATISARGREIMDERTQIYKKQKDEAEGMIKLTVNVMDGMQRDWQKGLETGRKLYDYEKQYDRLNDKLNEREKALKVAEQNYMRSVVMRLIVGSFDARMVRGYKKMIEDVKAGNVTPGVLTEYTGTMAEQSRKISESFAERNFDVLSRSFSGLATKLEKVSASFSEQVKEAEMEKIAAKKNAPSHVIRI